MKFLLKAFLTLLMLIVSFSSIACFFWYRPKFNAVAKSPAFTKENNANTAATIQRLKAHSTFLKQYTRANHFNQVYCFMADMKMGSGEKRFFVYNLLKDSVELTGLVTHGSGKNSSSGNVVFSNAANSLCTSLGKYKIGNSYFGKFGLAFKLYGLDQSNSNAYNRFVVLHAHACVPDEATAPFPICESWGCPTVSPLFLKALTKYITMSKQPVLLSIYE